MRIQAFFTFTLTVVSMLSFTITQADDSLSYKITATHVDTSGVKTPFQDKELSFDLTFRQDSDFAVSHEISANTDKNGEATLRIDPSAVLGFQYQGIELFCAKLDGPHYCNGVFTTTDNSLNPTDDVSEVLYNCTYSVEEAQPGIPGSIKVSCTDK